MRKRTLGRELALKYLFGVDLNGHESMQDFWEFASSQEKSAEAKEFGHELVEGVTKHHERIKAEIEDAAENWTWRRMPVVDRNILLLGAFEIRHRADIPAQVTINELVEVAKRYSTANSGAFVNGVLDTINHRVSAPESSQE